jgi:hypothetical protein
MSAFLSRAWASDSPILATNAVALGVQGTLEIVAPSDWTFVRTNLNMPGNPPSVELHSRSNLITLRLTIYPDRPGAGKLDKPTAADMQGIVSNEARVNYLPVSVEKTLVMEKLSGQGVSGSYVRLTDATWTPIAKDQYKNLTTGMFRSGNLWGYFDLETYDKDGPSFKQGMKVMESLHRK